MLLSHFDSFILTNNHWLNVYCSKYSGLSFYLRKGSTLPPWGLEVTLGAMHVVSKWGPLEQVGLSCFMVAMKAFQKCPHLQPMGLGKMSHWGTDLRQTYIPTSNLLATSCVPALPLRSSRILFLTWAAGGQASQTPQLQIPVQPLSLYHLCEWALVGLVSQVGNSRLLSPCALGPGAY